MTADCGGLAVCNAMARFGPILRHGVTTGIIQWQ